MQAVQELWLADEFDLLVRGSMCVAEDQPWLGGAVPVVSLEADDGLDGLAGLRREAGAGAEEDAAGAGAAGGEGEGDVAPLPHRARVVEQCGGHEQRDG